MARDRRVLIHGGTVYDGTGARGKRADVLVEGENIVEIGALVDAEADEMIDAAGRAVAPGFVDPHNHSDNGTPPRVIKHPLADNLVRQGITTIVCNQCGGGTLPIAPFLDEVDRARPATNLAMLASHGRARQQAMEKTGLDKPCAEMWAAMRDALTAEMESGAYGVTAGPLMQSQDEMPTEELVEAGRAVAPFGGVYASHIRDEGETGRHIEAIEEVYEVARESGATGQVSHLKLWGRPNWGQTDAVLAIFDRAKREGVPMAADQYPYIGGCRGLYSVMWNYCREQNPDDAWRRAAVAETRRQLDLLGGPERLILSSYEKDDPLDGKNLAEVGEALGMTAEEAPAALFLREPRPRISAFFLMMQEEDVRVFMKSEHTMAGTDSGMRVAGSGASHPRNYGTYPRLLGKYTREEKLMPLERMIHRMTGRVAEQFGIRDRGVLAVGRPADVVVFDPETVADRATWQDGYRYPVGIEWVLVNGGVTVADGEFAGSGFGRALRRG